MKGGPAILDRLDAVARNGAGFRARCPVHEDEDPSLHISVEGDKVLVFCHGCGADGVAVCRLLGIDPAEHLFLGSRRRNSSGPGVEVARYRYTEEQGNALYDSVRFEPKDFRLHPPGQSSGGISGIPRVLYRLHDVVAAVQAGEPVFIVEGEKDADRLVGLGLCATTNPMGAGKWSKVDASPLGGASVVILPDNDGPGRAHAVEVEADLKARGCDVAVVALPGLPEKGDVSDWLDSGGTAERLLQLSATDQSARSAEADMEEPDGHSAASGSSAAGSGRSWGPVELAGFLDGTHELPTPTVLHRSDGVGLFYRGEVHNLVGESGVGKGWVVLHATQQEISNGGCVLLIDFEDGPASLAARLTALGVDHIGVLAHFVYVRPEVALTLGDASDWLDDTLDNLAPTLVVIDGVTEAMVLHGLDPSSNPDAALFLMMLPRRVADHDCTPAVVLQDHPTKERDRQHRYALGAQHKRAGTAVTYIVEAVRPIEKGRTDGLIRVSVAKDRHGTVQAAGVGSGMPKLVAELHVTANIDGTEVEMSLDPPGAASSERVKALQAKVRRYLTEHPGASQNAIVDGVTGNSNAIKETLREMIDHGEIRVEEQGQTRHHYLVSVDDAEGRAEPVGTQGLFS